MKLFSSFKNHSKITSLSRLLFLLLVILLPISIQAQDCQPSNCVARCNGGCGTNQVCTLGTMKDCGVCPASNCVDQTVLGLPPSSTPTGANNNNSTDSEQNSQPDDNSGGNSGDKGGLIGGLVGGLLGGLLLFACVGFWAVRRFKGKSTDLPFTTQQQRMSEKNIASTSREITSGVIPVAYIPPSSEEEPKTTVIINNDLSPAPNTQRSSILNTPHLAALAASNEIADRRYESKHLASDNSTKENNATDDRRYVSKYLDESSSANETTDRQHASKYLSASYESDGESSLGTRASITSTTSNNPTTPSKTVHAVQVQRARPQIMRVNQVLVSNIDGDGLANNFGGAGISRSGSVRTILTRDDGSDAGSIVHLSRSNTAPAKRLLSTRSPRPALQQSRSSLVQRHYPSQQQRPTTIINTDPELIEATVNKSLIINRGSPRSEDDPFHDRHSALVELMPEIPASYTNNDTTRRRSIATAGTTRHHSNTPTTESGVLGDGEITIYWNNAYDEQQKDDNGIIVRPSRRPST
ncbi:hypothetical protein INT45_001946 [Circinella minor]|uniref:Membrane anchor Opy2 N-terminal domain-containing protein n=1 Tax=Circinella minor TaxID=1195481 RepID=A0A8H7S8R6_9FUNG|nr:hypothetical protein INT45_001946 [Circinella minor]